MPMPRTLVLLFFILVQGLPALALESATPSRRAALISLVPARNEVKSLALTDFGGWAYFSDLLVGSYSQDWLAAFSYSRKQFTWFAPAEGELSVPPALIGSSLVVGFRNGRLSKIDPLTGKNLWSIELDSYPNRAIPMVGSTLLVATASQILYAIDFQTGKTEWLYDSGFPEGIVVASQSPPITRDGVVYLGLTTGELAAVDLKSGTELWRFNPVYSEGRFKDLVGEIGAGKEHLVVARYDGFIGGIRVGDSSTKVEVLWRHLLGSITTSLFRDGRFYVSTAAGDLICYESTSGKQIWKTTLGDSVGRMTSDENTLYFAGNTGLVGAVDQRSGRLLWYDELSAKLSVQPAIIEDKIYFATGLKNLYGYSLRGE